MIEFALILFGAAFTTAASYSFGILLLKALGVRLYREEQRLIGFVCGSACLSLLVFLASALRQAKPSVFGIIGGLLCLVGYAVHRIDNSLMPLPPLPRRWKWALSGVLLAFGGFYLVNALAPEVSPDGSSYHLGLVSRYLAARGFYPVTTNMYAYLSQGVEMLFLFAFAFGKHSAAATVHWTFYAALPLLMVSYGRRIGQPVAGITGALLVAAAPIVGWDGAAAYNDVALACALFALFYLLQIWDAERSPALLIPIGLLAGFAYAVKYTGFLAVPYAIVFVFWKSVRARKNPVRPALVVGVLALVLIAPWMLKNWVTVDNPFSPFFNRWFPNPYVYTGFEQQYRAVMAEWGDVKNPLQIPYEVTVRGDRLQGLLGPVFLLAPLGLFAVRWPAGRQVLLAALIFLLTYGQNIGTRFLIPALPFLAMALALVVARWRWAAAAVIAAHAITAWPYVIPRYAQPYAVYSRDFPLAAATRFETRDEYLKRRLGLYDALQMVEAVVPRSARILTFSGVPEAYTNREFLVGYQGSLNRMLTDLLVGVQAPQWHPTRRATFTLNGMPARYLRIEHNATGSNREDYWRINEVRLFYKGKEIAREPQWRVTASPNRFDAPLAFDNNPVTAWVAWERLAPGHYLSFDLGRNERIDTVVLEGPPRQDEAAMRLHVANAQGARLSLPDPPALADAPLPDHLRRWVASELRWHGIEYLFLLDSDFVAADVRQHMREYGLSPAGQAGAAKLYRVE